MNKDKTTKWLIIAVVIVALYCIGAIAFGWPVPKM